MDPLYAKAHGKVGGSSTKVSSSKKKKRSNRSQSAGQPSGRPQLGTGEPTSERRAKSKRGSRDASQRSVSDGSSKAVAATMNILNVLDTAIGTTYIVGATIDREAAVMAFAISLGSVLLLSSLCGALGYFSKSCNRSGLVLSLILGTIVCLSYIGGFIWALASWDSFVAFLDSDQQILEDSKIAVVVILAVLAVFETIRIITTSITRKQLLEKDAQTKSGSYRSTSTSSSSSTWQFLSWCGLAKKKRSDDFVMFDDNASMESALLWSKDGGQPSSDDYLEFVPDHERGLAIHASNVAMPLPPEDKVDY